MRAAELALPRLAHDRSLRFATLPDGEDPDTLVRRQGPAGLRAALDAARPLAEVLFDLLREATGDRSPEQRAALRARIDETAKAIPDRGLSQEYRSALRDRFFAQRADGRRGGGREPFNKRGPGAPQRPVALSARPPISETQAGAERGRILTAVLLRHPDLLRDVEHAFADVVLPADCDRLRKAVLAWADHAPALDSRGLMTHLTSSGLAAEAEQILATVPVPLPGFARAEAMPGDAEAGWWHIFGLMHLGRLREELVAAERAARASLDEGTQRRLIALHVALQGVMATEPEDPGS